MEELAQYDPNLVVGILGGSAGTTYDAFKLIHDAQKYGARVALFGRKINNAEHQLAFIQMLRFITDGRISPEEAVHAYHSVLQKQKIQPKLPLEKDLMLTDPAMSYGGSGGSRTSVTVTNNPVRSEPQKPSSPSSSNHQPPRGHAKPASWPVLANGAPNFEAMTTEERRAYHLSRLTRRFG